MARWLVQLTGERFDLEEFPRLFPTSEVYAIEEIGEFFLASEAFERLSEPQAVLAAAETAFVQMFAIASLLEVNLQRPTLSGVIRKDDAGKRQTFIFGTGTVMARSKVAGIATVSENDGANPPANPPAGPTQAERMLYHARAPHLVNALELWGNGLLTWPRLYRILEEAEGHLKATVDRVGMCTKAQRERFTRTANVAEVSGLDSRHAAGKWERPKDPMSINDARNFVRSVLQGVLDREENKFNAPKGSQ